MNLLIRKSILSVLPRFPILLVQGTIPYRLNYKNLYDNIYTRFHNPSFDYTDKCIFVFEHDWKCKKDYNDIASIVCERNMYGSVIIMDKLPDDETDISYIQSSY